jgi:hypothetical protein
MRPVPGDRKVETSEELKTAKQEPMGLRPQEGVDSREARGGGAAGVGDRPNIGAHQFPVEATGITMVTFISTKIPMEEKRAYRDQ